MDYLLWDRWGWNLETCILCAGIHLHLFYRSPLGDRVAKICVKCQHAEVEDFDAVLNRVPKSNQIGNRFIALAHERKG
jgi:hypothetical protein